ncbi:hypothetical protein TAMA11512_12860 [Selenomonas sp. TAMA-11512]|uniref:transglycosylase SLT domain-containing protein n=1 Tax=Selenomonas sp. TAMA-11512 TaxID=3095337 RepID=UPI003090E32C|nr:hypothetical protein TAMA11512_12860 [Selenomonas sp. TAMA-11512]
MKFTTYDTSVPVGIMRTPAVQAPVAHLRFEAGGQQEAAVAGAIGKVIDILQKRQDEEDDIAVQEGMNAIRTAVTEKLYGEEGLFATRVGKHAKGLMQDTESTIRDTAKEIGQQYNGRVQRRIAAGISDNMLNYMRSAGTQERNELENAATAEYSANLDGLSNTAGKTWMVSGAEDSLLQEGRNLIGERAQKLGWSGAQVRAMETDFTTKLVAERAGAMIAAGNTDGAYELLEKHQSDMDPERHSQLIQPLTKQRTEREVQMAAKSILPMLYNVKTGLFDEDALEKAATQYAQVRVQGAEGSVGWSGDAGIDGEINDAAQEFGVDPALVAAIANVETAGFDQNAVSSAGARGIMQLMPGTAAGLGVNPDDRRDNIRGGAKYLKGLLEEFGGDIRLTAAAYNAGPQAVKDAGGVPNYAETKAYVEKVQKAYQENKEKGNAGGGNVLGITPYYMGTQDGISADRLQPKWKDGILGIIGGALKDNFGLTGVISSTGRTREHNREVGGAEHSHHIDDGNGGDAVDIVLPDGVDKSAIVKYFKSTGAFEEVLFHDAGSGDHLHLGGYKGTFTGNAGTSGYTYVDENKKAAFIAAVRAQASDQTTVWKKQQHALLEHVKDVVDEAGGRAEAMIAISGIGGLERDAQRAAMKYINEVYPLPGKHKEHIQGASGKEYTRDDIEDAQDRFNEYQVRRDDSDDTISPKDQTKYNKAARILQDVGLAGSGDNTASGESLKMAILAVRRTSNDEEAEWYLQQEENGGFSPSEARYYVEQAKAEMKR